jgi:hypothetical protein
MIITFSKHFPCRAETMLGAICALSIYVNFDYHPEAIPRFDIRKPKPTELNPIMHLPHYLSIGI